MPGYATTLAGFGVYSLVVSLLGGPTSGLVPPTSGRGGSSMLWIIPPFLLPLSLVLRLSARVASRPPPPRPPGLVTLPMIAIVQPVDRALFGDAEHGVIRHHRLVVAGDQVVTPASDRSPARLPASPSDIGSLPQPLVDLPIQNQRVAGPRQDNSSPDRRWPSSGESRPIDDDSGGATGRITGPGAATLRGRPHRRH